MGKLVAMFPRLRIAPLFWILIPLAISLPIKSLRWNLLIRTFGIRESQRESFHVYTIGIFSGLLTPGRLGELIKAKNLTDKGLSWRRAILACVLDRGLDLASLGVLALGVLFPLGWVTLGPLAALGGAAALLVISCWRIWEKRFGTLLLKLRPVNAEETSGGQEQQTSGRFLGLYIALLTMLFWVCYFLQISGLMQAAGLVYSPDLWVSPVAAAAIIAMLPISVMGLGTRELALLHLLCLPGAELEAIVIFSLLYTYIYAINGVIGTIVLLKKKPPLH
jgi:glycosyltransferase 2 family protein